MPGENVEVVRRALDAFTADDVESLLLLMDSEIEFESHLAMVEGNYKGHDGVREFMTDAFESLRVTGIDHWESRDLGDRVLAFGSFHFHGRESGIEDDVRYRAFAHPLRAWSQTLVRGTRSGGVPTWQPARDLLGMSEGGIVLAKSVLLSGRRWGFGLLNVTDKPVKTFFGVICVSGVR
jgi:hypothetical protein